MAADEGCPLSPSLRRLMLTSIAMGDTSDRALAECLCVSPATVHTEWRRILEVTSTHSRFAAVLHALRHGWLRMSEADGAAGTGGVPGARGPPLRAPPARSPRAHRKIPRSWYCAGCPRGVYWRRSPRRVPFAWAGGGAPRHQSVPGGCARLPLV